MSTKDISRFLFRPKQHYVGARMQQGRVLLDSDFNEEANLDDEDQRRALKDVIGPKGSPDDGFSLDLAVGDQVVKEDVSFDGAAPVTVLNYRIRPGSMYVGGMRFEMEQRFDAGVPLLEPIVFQRDFLQMRAADAPKPVTGATHSQLTYLRAFEQCVTAVEDEEIREKALAGLDTSVRVRRMRRLEVREVDNGLDCDAAWQSVRAALEAETGGTFDADGCELRSGVRLQLTFQPGAAQDPCAPCVPGGAGRYLGAQNQAIRVMVAEPGKYVWGFDNASPLYRVRRKTAVGTSVPIEMITPPKDEAHRPVVNTVVEFLPWSALLDNGEKMAGLVGVFTRITGSFDPSTNEFTISSTDAAQIDALVNAWDTAHPDKAVLPNLNDPDGDYFFLRVWHVLDHATDPALLDMGPDPLNHVLIQRIGLSPTFVGGGIAGDFWVATVRPDTPQEIVPWDLTDTGGIPPHGPRQFFAPLTLLTLRQPHGGEHSNTEVVESIHDCRSRFRPLVRQAGCCVHTVGDGDKSRGDFNSIQAAIRALPEAGGKVCVLPGTYREQVVIDRSDVLIEGCGSSSRLESPGGGSASEALLQIKAPRVTVRELGIAAAGQVGVLVGEVNPTAALVATDVLLENLEVTSARGSTPARSAIDVRLGQDVVVRGCELTLDGTVTDDSVVFVRGQRLLVEGNRITTRLQAGIFGAWGGLQIGGGSTDVEVRRNHIQGGIGHGITLGSLLWTPVTTTTTETVVFGPGANLVDKSTPCIQVAVSGVGQITRDNVTFVPDTAGDLDDVRIIDNLVEDMAANGISVLALVPFSQTDVIDFITTDNLLVERNRIINNLQQPARLTATSAVVAKKAAVLQGQQDVFGQFVAPPLPASGILLAEGHGIRIRHNDIRGNGANDPEAICAICIIFGDNILIEGNRIQANGLFDPGAATGRFGVPGGIVVFLAGIGDILEDGGPQTDAAGTSLRVLGNFVEQPNGNALFARATGPIVVDGNHLLSQGNNATSQAPFTSYTVTLFNVGLAWEALELPTGEPSDARWDFPHNTDTFLQRPQNVGSTLGIGGKVLFVNNHVTLSWVPPTTTTSGLAFGTSLGIATLDDVTMVGNQLALNVEDPVPKKKGSTGVRSPGFPRIATHAVIVGATANVSNNRIAEPVNDVFISLLVLGGLLASSTHNVTTHANFVRTSNNINQAVPIANNGHFTDQGNLVLLAPDPATQQPFDPTSTRTIAQVFFAIFSNLFLELPPGSGPA